MTIRMSRFLVVLAIAGASLLAAGNAGAETPGPDGAPAYESGDATPLEVDEAVPDYDPWQPFNEKTFKFNHDVLDRCVLKPIATGWDKVIPDLSKRALDRAFDNLDMPRRFMNNLFQLRPKEAGGELVRFFVNSTVGVAGFIDVAHMTFHLEKSDADMGQTLGVYGVGAGPYLVLPFLSPLTIRDGIGRGIDSALDPFGFFIPRVVGVPMGVVRTVNDRSLNLRLFADVEESVIDLYSAVRNGYLQRRRSVVEMRRITCRHPDTALTPANAAVAADALAVDGDRP